MQANCYTVAVHCGASSHTVDVDSFDDAYRHLTGLLAALRSSGHDGFGTVRNAAGVMVLAADVRGHVWSDPALTPERLAV